MTRARITKAWDTPPEELPDFSEEDSEMLACFLPDTFHKIHDTLSERGWSVSSAVYVGGRELHYTFQTPPYRLDKIVLRLRYIRQRKGTYYCQHAAVNDVHQPLYKILKAL